MRHDIQCSNCGIVAKIRNRKGEHIEDRLNEGWRGYGGVLYCPQCCATWSERNGDKKLHSKDNSFWTILAWLDNYG